MSGKRTYAEDRIQAAIVDYLRATLRSARVFSVPNGGLRSKAEAAKLKWTGVLAGIPDLVIIAPGGRSYFIEVKRPDGVLSAEQKEMLAWFDTCHIPNAVCRSVDDAQDIIAEWGLPTRDAQIEAAA